jgi:hypothetical protein
VNAYSLFAQECGPVNRAESGKWQSDDGFFAAEFSRFAIATRAYAREAY